MPKKTYHGLKLPIKNPRVARSEIKKINNDTLLFRALRERRI